jgi:hypothetical protein
MSDHPAPDMTRSDLFGGIQVRIPLIPYTQFAVFEHPASEAA